MGTIENAIITKTDFGYARGCIQTFYVYVKCELFGVGIGGYSLSEYDKEKDDHIYRGESLEAMMKICEVVGVENWEDLIGKYCRVELEKFGTGCHRIGNIIKNEWFDLKRFFEERSKNCGDRNNT